MEKQDSGIPTEIARLLPKHLKTAESLRTDKELILKVLHQHKEGWRLLKEADSRILDDREVLLAAIKYCPLGWKSLAFASDALRNDLDLGKEAIRQNAAAIELLAPEARKNEELVSEAFSSFSKRLLLKVKMSKKEEDRDWERINQVSKQVLDKRSSIRASVLNFIVPRTANRMVKNSEEWTEMLNAEIDVLQLDATATYSTFTRLIPLVALRIVRAGRSILSVMGHIENSELTCDVRLPGKRIHDDEDPRDALQRLISTSFRHWEKWILVQASYECIVEEAPSLTAEGQHTRYIKAVFTAHLDEKMNWANGCEFIPCGPQRKTTQRALSQLSTLGQRFSLNCTTPQPPDIFVFSFSNWPERTYLFSWIPEFEYQWLRYTETGKANAKQWLSQLQFPTSVNVDLSSGVVARKNLLELPLIDSARPETRACLTTTWGVRGLGDDLTADQSQMELKPNPKKWPPLSRARSKLPTVKKKVCTPYNPPRDSPKSVWSCTLNL